jgi:hypothetical protein
VRVLGAERSLAANVLVEPGIVHQAEVRAVEPAVKPIAADPFSMSVNTSTRAFSAADRPGNRPATRATRKISAARCLMALTF